MSVTLAAGTRIGDYEILAPLRAGGMASLYLGRRAGVAGFVKPVAIKVIHAHLARDPAFIEMFLDEARLSAKIADPNVVHVEDLGEADGMFYLAMEYVLGVSLAALLARLVQSGTPLDPPVACAIAMRVADGLHAAHELRDDAGVSLEVVHRDVSPQNVLVSEAGHVKLIDFGVARARGRLQETEAGALKGKVRYMSPEQAWGRPIDRRTDVYALGIVLWEMLCLRRFIEGDNDIEALELARAPALVPPSRHRPELVADLDQVILTALARDPEDRWASAQAFRRALSGAVPEALRVEPGDLAVLVESLCGKQIANERKLLTDPGRPSAERLAVASSEASPAAASPRADAPTRADSSRGRPGSEAGSHAPTSSEPSADVSRADVPRADVARADVARADAPASSSRPARGMSRGAMIATGVGLAALALLGALLLLAAGAMLPGVLDRTHAGATSQPVVPPASASAPPSDVDPCLDAPRLVARLGETVSTTLDTSGARPAFELVGLRNPDARGVPDRVVEIEIPGEGRTTVDISTDTAFTDEHFDTVLAVFEGECRADMARERPVFTADDHGRQRHARGSVGARAGSVLTLVLSGFGGGTYGMADRGRVGVEVTARRATPPGILSVRGIVAGEQVVFEVEGRDEDHDADRARVRLFDGAGAPLTLVARGQRVALPEQWLLLPLQTESVVHGQARFLARSGDADTLSLARRAEVVLVDQSGNATAPQPVALTRGREVGPGDACGPVDVCAAELKCGTGGACEPLAERQAACAMATALPLVAGGETRVVRQLPEGEALFEVSCAETRARGREDVQVIEIPEGRWDLVLATEPAEDRSAPDDMVLSIRRDCLDARATASPPAGCNDDRSAESTRPRVELRDVPAGERWFVLASSTRSDPGFMTGGLAYQLIVQLRPIRAEGEACDPEMRTDRCDEGACDAVTRTCAASR